jgi:hypothetical protein
VVIPLRIIKIKMNSKINLIKTFLLCPVPTEQKPITEYIQIKNYFWSKSTNEQNILLKFILLFSAPFFLWNWAFIQQKFNLPYIVYEEASWYDGQIWEKPFFLIKNDRIITNQKISPILKKYKILSFIVFGLLILNFLKLFIV